MIKMIIIIMMMMMMIIPANIDKSHESLSLVRDRCFLDDNNLIIWIIRVSLDFDDDDDVDNDTSAILVAAAANNSQISGFEYSCALDIITL